MPTRCQIPYSAVAPMIGLSLVPGPRAGAVPASDKNYGDNSCQRYDDRLALPARHDIDCCAGIPKPARRGAMQGIIREETTVTRTR
jgi:hypothetical protein